MPTSRPGGEIELRGLTKRFGDFVALDSIDLDVRGGEFFSLLGPSGCGKSTTLRLIGGFEAPTAGVVRVDGTDLASTPAHKRPVNTVFQSYALFPHMSVEKNVAYGLRWREGVTKAERVRRVGDAIAMVELQGFEMRRPAQLSGGQQQRVALARALVLKPSVLLLDEPLGALDAKLRKTLQHELSTLQREVGITFVYVTHDQEEALTMSDRLAVMDRGRIVQVGAPKDVYESPATTYVADFLGVANLIDAVAVDDTTVMVCGIALRAEVGSLRGLVKTVVRPERVRLVAYGSDQSSSGESSSGESSTDQSSSVESSSLAGLVERVVYLGATSHVVVRLADGTTIQVMVPNRDGAVDVSSGTAVRVVIPANALRVLAMDETGLGATEAGQRGELEDHGSRSPN